MERVYYGYNKEFTLNVFRNMKKRGIIKRLFEDVKISGLENLAGNRQRFYFPNHLSHSDYLLLGYILLDNGIRLPRFVAGRNLDLKVLSSLRLDFRKMGAIFIDRDLIEGNREEACKHASYFKDSFLRLLDSGEDICAFVEGGRSYDGSVMGNVKTGFFKVADRQRDIDVVTIAFHYDSRIEERVFPLLALFKHRRNLFESLMYYGIDATTYFARLFGGRNRGKAYINIGEPVALNEVASSSDRLDRRRQLKEFVVSSVRELHSQIVNEVYESKI